MAASTCAICNSPSQTTSFSDGKVFYEEVICPRCGQYFISDYVKDYVQAALQLDTAGIRQYLSMEDEAGLNPTIALFQEVAKAADKRGTDVPRSIISHVLRKRTDKRAPLTYEILTGILKNNSLPSPAQQANNFITLLGGRLSSPGDLFDVSTHLRPNQSHENIYSLIGIKTGSAESKDFRFIISALVEQGVLNADERDVIFSDDLKIPSRVSLTMGGWQKYEELRRSVKNSRKAFVAMEFPKEGSDQNYFFQETLFDKYLVPAVKQTGYDLANALRSEPTAGNLHARLEVEIRAARFVVAELSHHNNGAYWEAGFARGLEKPVIYMYNKEIGESERPHFDVGSDHYIAWEQGKPEKAAEDLKAVIRATLFGEAAMED